MRIKKEKTHAEMNMTVRAYIDSLQHGEFTFDIDIQRAYVWKDLEQRSALIQSLILNDIIPPFIFNKVEDRYEGLDSKQRSLTIMKYMDNEFALKGVCSFEVVNDDGEIEEIDINNCKFSELPECFQDAIKEYNLSIWYIDEADQEQVSRNFCNLNNGKMINAATINRIKAKSRDKINYLASHPVFKEALSKTAMDGHVNDDLVIKSHAMLYAENPCMDVKWIRPYMRNTDIKDDEVTMLYDVFFRIQAIHSLVEDKKVARRAYVRLHTISIVPIVYRSIRDGLSNEDMAKWFSVFFNGSRSATISSVYNSAASSGTGKKESVQKRLDEITKSYEEYFGKCGECLC